MFGGIKSIAELAVRDWCRSIGLDMHYIKLGMDGNEAMIEDDIGNTLRWYMTTIPSLSTSKSREVSGCLIYQDV